MVELQTLPNLQTLSIPHLARMISHAWPRPNYVAAQYLNAMHRVRELEDSVGLRDGYAVVSGFLGCCKEWKGDVAKAIKTELARRIL